MRAKTNMLMPAMAVLTILGIISMGIVIEARGHGAPWSDLVAARSQAIGAQASSGESEPAVTPASASNETGAYRSVAPAVQPPATVAVATPGSRGRTSSSEGLGPDAGLPVVSPEPTQPSQEPADTSPEPAETSPEQVETSPETTVPGASDQALEASTPPTVPAIVAIAATDEPPTTSLLGSTFGGGGNGGVSLVAAARSLISLGPSDEVDTETQHD